MMARKTQTFDAGHCFLMALHPQNLCPVPPLGSTPSGAALLLAASCDPPPPLLLLFVPIVLSARASIRRIQ